MNGGALERLILEARRRFVFALAVEQSVFALSLFFAGAIALILLGTQILGWGWPAALSLGALAFGIYRLRRSIPGHYAIAQSIDRRLGLHDSLSTAWHFRNTDEDVFSPEVRAAQRRQAESVAATLDASTALPFTMPKGWRICAMLATAACALFAVRYGVRQSLDLSRPIVAFELNPFGAGAVEEARNRKPANPAMDEFMKQLSVQPPDQQPEEGLDPAPDSALGTVEVPDVDNDNAQGSNKSTNEKGPGSGDEQQNGDSGEEGEGASSGDPNRPGNEQGKSGERQDQKGQNQNAKQPGESSSMLDKMRDAFANLMNKMNVQQKQGAERQQQQAKNSKGGQPSGNARQQPSQKGMQSKGSPSSSDQQQSSNQQGDQDMQDSDPSQSAQGKPGDRNSQSASNQENKSGMGKQDGDKDVKLAEQLAAMGKISEIIGKRNANLQGEVMVEVNSSKQTLKTQYSERNARHAEAGGEIHRDEIPLAYHSYVQRYFDEVRKTPPPPKPPAAASPQPRPTDLP
jgi:hypothetical protein